jgi:cell division protein FtsA
MYAALDLGTSKICALIGEKDEQGNLMIHGEGTAPTQGIKGGVIVDMDSAVKCIIELLQRQKILQCRSGRGCNWQRWRKLAMPRIIGMK